MKFSDKHLNRLLKSAGTSLAPEEQMPGPLQSRILARWKAGELNGEALDLLRLFRVGFAVACTLLVIAVFFTLQEADRAPSDELAMPNLVLDLAFR